MYLYFKCNLFFSRRHSCVEREPELLGKRATSPVFLKPQRQRWTVWRQIFGMLLVEGLTYPRYRLMFKSTTFAMPTSQLPTLSGLSWRSLFRHYLLHHSTPNTSLCVVHQILVNFERKQMTGKQFCQQQF